MVRPVVASMELMFRGSRRQGWEALSRCAAQRGVTPTGCGELGGSGCLHGACQLCSSGGLRQITLSRTRVVSRETASCLHPWLGRLGKRCRGVGNPCVDRCRSAASAGTANADGPRRDGEVRVLPRRGGMSPVRLEDGRCPSAVGGRGVRAVTVIATPCLSGAAKAGLRCPDEQSLGDPVGSRGTYRAEPLVTNAWLDVSWGPQSERPHPDARSRGHASAAPLSTSSRRRAEDWLAQLARTRWREVCASLGRLPVGPGQFHVKQGRRDIPTAAHKVCGRHDRRAQVRRRQEQLLASNQSVR